jgi:hypothetical protein
MEGEATSLKAHTTVEMVRPELIKSFCSNDMCFPPAKKLRIGSQEGIHLYPNGLIACRMIYMAHDHRRPAATTLTENKIGRVARLGLVE